MIDDVPTFKQNHESKLSPQQVREIRAKLKDGVMHKVLSIDYGVSNTTINSIKANKYYKGIV